MRTPRPHRHHIRSDIPWSSVLLGLMAMLVLVMPVNYRAGADTSHPHTVFQTVLDQVTGRPHYHGPDDPWHTHAPASTTLSPSPFAPPAIPLNALRGPEPPQTALAAHNDGDVPWITSAKPTLDQPLILASLGALLLLAAMIVMRRQCWPDDSVPGSCVIAPEPPPPRLFSVPACR